MVNYSKITLDFGLPDKVRPVVKAKQGDYLGRAVLVAIKNNGKDVSLDYNDGDYDFIINYTLGNTSRSITYFGIEYADETVIPEPKEIEDEDGNTITLSCFAYRVRNKICIPFNQEMLANAGEIVFNVCMLTQLDEDSMEYRCKTTTEEFYVEVEETMAQPEEVDTSSTEYSVLEGLIAQVATATSGVEEAVTSANTAAANANTAVNNATSAVASVNAAVASVNAAVASANAATSNANTAATSANTAATSADTATANANTATNNVNAVYQDARTALSNANTTLNRVNTAYEEANTAINRALTAVQQCNSAKDRANTASAGAENVNISATSNDNGVLITTTNRNGEQTEVQVNHGAKGDKGDKGDTGERGADGAYSSYEELDDKPSINNVTLDGNVTFDDLNIQAKLTAGDNINIDADGVISATGGSANIRFVTVNKNGENYVHNAVHNLLASSFNGGVPTFVNDLYNRVMARLVSHDTVNKVFTFSGVKKNKTILYLFSYTTTYGSLTLTVEEVDTTVPTNISEFTNDSGYLTVDTLPRYMGVFE